MKRMKTVCSVLLVGLSLPGLALENAYATPVETAMTQTQDRKVAFTGTVQDSKGEAIVGATILVKGQAKGKGTLTDPKGHFVLSGLKVGSELVISCVGYKTQTVRWTGTPLSITLEDEMTQLSGVVVTALGIRREKKALGYAMQEVKGDQLMAVREPNITNALSGKVSGIQIIKGSSSPGSSSKIVLRGNSSLSGSNQPLIVVDGVPMDNTTGATNNDFWNPAADMGNGLSDINAEDIESMTVLKGASAAALYGSRAGNGVIQIITKSGRKNNGLGVTISSSVGVERLFMVPRLQSQFGQGTDGAYKNDVSSSWGPRIEGQEYTKWDGTKTNMQAYDNVANYFKSPGIDLTENIAFSQMYDRTSIYSSLTRTDNKSHIPGASLGRTNMTLRATTKFGPSDRWSTDTKVQYIRSFVQNRPLNGANASNAFYTMYSLPRSMDIRDFEEARTPQGAMRWYGVGNQTNPYWASKYNLNNDTRDRFLISAALKYKITDWLNAELRVGSDQYSTRIERKTYAGSPIAGGGGKYETEQIKFYENNYSFLVSAQRDNVFGKLGLSGSVGGNLMERKHNGLRASVSQLIVPNLFSLTNGTDKPDNSESYSHKKINSLYGTAQLNWDGYFFLDGTLRNDWSSSLAKANRSFLYPSISTSLVITDMLRKMDVTAPSWLSFAKVRASAAQVGNDLEPYQLYSAYRIEKDPLGGTMANIDNVLYNDKVRSELIKSYELGLEMRFFDSRFGVDFAWYRTNATNQLIRLGMDPASGYDAKMINAGNIQNEGIEFMVTADIIRSEGLKWNAQLNLSHNENRIIKLYDGGGIESPVTEYNLGTYDNLKILAREGGKYGEIWGSSYKRVEDKTSDLYGKIITDENGLPIAGDEKKLGDQQPDLLAGLTNSFSFAGFDLSFLIDARFGGKMFSGTNHALQAGGAAAATVVNGARDKFVVDGAVESEVAGKTVYKKNTVEVTPQDYWGAIVGRSGNLGINEANIYDATSVRLRNIALSYTLPKSLLKNTPITKAKLGISCNNVWMIKSYMNGIDPESVFATGSNATGYEFASSPTTRSFLFNITLGF
ncbi:SusC/RagA family TonB-linked outer membrane protein [Porphyromonas sp.]|uniref:SusC/RagA family TonB-linked outer membrane protein n=1 Tax=Porphyromonas sp. TaxID=1924944 RepID=UPI001CADCB31|nr:SusC/RagA family TonB-linked outer membrane protein [Porphyromonas sp.]MBF1382446.1 SusC/RagA family TonB-linked outer membrane protein [Porphyromonas sp.]